MVISYNWLCDYLPEQVPVDKLSEILTSIGLEVEAVEPVEFVKGNLQGLVIGHVLTCEKHQNADKLKVTTVDVGAGEPLHIVCGAGNVTVGQKVVVATVGTIVHPVHGEPFEIKKAKIRGEVSEGMICAEDEIGLGESHDGIMVLPGDVPVGSLAAEYFNIPAPDKAIHIGLTPNRSDAMSHIGVAKDVITYLAYHEGKDIAVTLPETQLQIPAAPEESIKINLHNTEACPRYMGILLKNVRVAPSPEWLQRRLQAIGLRPINNVVDITNYVLHEWGQPLHAFDADKIEGKVINVQTLAAGIPFVTLDEKERKLTEHDLVICDENKGMCIAGVFGGTGSGVTDTTTNVFIESAYFSPLYIRRTSMHHGLRTDAATHFEKGVDINNLEPALKRAAALVKEIAGGEIASGIVDEYPLKPETVQVQVTYDYISKLSGKNYPADAVQKILSLLGFGITEATGTGLTVSVPTNKSDVTQPADIVEEIVRIDGLDNIPIPGKLNITLNKPMPNDRAERDKIASVLCGLGFREIVTNSITNSKYYAGEESLVKMMNSLSSELDVLRPSMLESGLEVIQYNCNRKNNRLALFEFGKVYRTHNNKYEEETQLALYITGTISKPNWNAEEQPYSVFYLKGILNNLFSYTGTRKLSYAYSDGVLNVEWKKQLLATVTAVSKDKLAMFDIKQDVYFAAIKWEMVLKAMAEVKVKYAEVPRFPAVQRDLSIILDKEVTYKDVQDATEKLSIESLQEYSLFDIFESDKLGEGKKSFALNYTFQLQDRTLTDEETDKLMQMLMNSYKKELNAYIRE